MKLEKWSCMVTLNSEMAILKPVYIFVMNGIFDYIGSCHV
jgi:hypothetical protein